MSDRKERQLAFTRADGTKGVVSMHGSADDIAALKEHLGDVQMGAPDAGKKPTPLPDTVWVYSYPDGSTSHLVIPPGERPALPCLMDFQMGEYRRKDSAEEQDLKLIADAFVSLARAIAFSPHDWSEHRRLAWVYGITNGWDGQITGGEEVNAMSEVAAQHRWDAATVQRLRMLRAAVERHVAKYPAPPPTEAVEKASQADNFQGP